MLELILCSCTVVVSGAGSGWVCVCVCVCELTNQRRLSIWKGGILERQELKQFDKVDVLF